MSSITVEDYPSTWEEEFVLSHQKLSFNNVPFKVAMQKTVDNLDKYYKEHNIYEEVGTDLEGYVKIDNERKIVIRQQNKNTMQILLLKNDQECDDYIEIIIQNPYYIIDYYCKERVTRARYSLDESDIRELFGKVASF